MKKMLFVYNPFSGKAQIKNKLNEIVNIFTRAGYLVTIYPTQCVNDGYERVLEAEGQYDIIACSGGDGTLNEIISAVMQYKESKPKVGYIPAGSTNDFAKTLGIPKNMIKAADKIAEGDGFACDIGMFNKRYFNYVAAFGIFTEVSYTTPQSTKNILGHQAYILESLKSISKIKSYDMRVKCNDEVFEGRYIYGMVANSESVGGIKGITGRDISLNDGMFEVVLVYEPNNPVELSQAVGGLFSKADDSPMVLRIKTDRVEFECDEAVPWTLDGEDGDNHETAVIDILRKAVEIVV